MNSYLLSIQNVIAAEIKTLEREALLLSSSHLSQVLDLMQNTQGRVVFTGMGKSGIIAQKIVASLSSTGTPSIFIQIGRAHV